jgi:integrase
MAKRTGKDWLNARGVATIKEPGYHADGGGLYLCVTSTNAGISKSWILRYQVNRKRREMGLGSLSTLSLSEARKRRDEELTKAKGGIDPIAARKEERTTRRNEKATLTFSEAATKYIDLMEPGWRNVKHASQWRNTVETYANPVIGKLSIDQVGQVHILEILEPIWYTKTETATRLRGRLERILSWAKVHGYRTGENPARWKDHLGVMLPSPESLGSRRHHPAMPYQEVAAYMKELRETKGVSARCLEFTVLTACRTIETTGARWEEFDLNRNLWTVPASRMKGKIAHRVPLSPQARAVIDEMAKLQASDFVFPGRRVHSHLSNMAMLELLQDKHSTLTVHGFRSSFRDWAAECTAFPRLVAEAALAHTIDDKTEAAYLRSDFLEQRRRLMEHWAVFSGQEISVNNVLTIKAAS